MCWPRSTELRDGGADPDGRGPRDGRHEGVATEPADDEPGEDREGDDGHGGGRGPRHAHPSGHETGDDEDRHGERGGGAGHDERGEAGQPQGQRTGHDHEQDTGQQDGGGRQPPDRDDTDHRSDPRGGRGAAGMASS